MKANAARVRKRGKQAGIAELAVQGDIVKVTEIPVLGSGKTDYRATRDLVIERLSAGSAA